MQIMPFSTASRLASKADHTLFSRPRPQTLLVSAAPAPMPTVWTKLRRVMAMATAPSPTRSSSTAWERCGGHRLADIGEDEVGLRIGRGVAEIRERLDREVTHRLVAGRFFLDVLR